MDDMEESMPPPPPLVEERSLSLKEKRELIQKISKLNKKYHVHVLTFLINDLCEDENGIDRENKANINLNTKYTENSSGIYIRLNDLPEDTIARLEVFVKQCYENEKLLFDANVEYSTEERELKGRYNTIQK